jgi:hypothetical protein
MPTYKLAVAALAVSITATLALSGRGFSGPGTSPTATPFVEPLPALTWPVTDKDDLAQVLKACGVKSASAAWLNCIDLDGDGKEDAVVTLALEPQNGPRWGKSVRATYVFRGTTRGSFGGAFSTATFWFSLNTGCALDHVEYGDQETRKTFSLCKVNEQWQVEVRTYYYETGPGDGTSRCRHLVRSSQEDIPAETLRVNPREFE